MNPLGVRPVSLAAMERLIAHPPKLQSARDFHPDAPDELVDYGISGRVLTFMASQITPGQASLETGAGLSTVCFAMLGTHHLCISPAPGEHARIRAYCQAEGISTEHLRFVAACSETYLPMLDLGGQQLDVVLIDGMHKFPHAIIDYFYLHPHLRVGGLLIVDDLDIASVGLLHRFLLTSDSYRIVGVIGGTTGVFRKLDADESLDFRKQRFNHPHPNYSYLPIHMRLRKRLGAFPPAGTPWRFLKRSFGGKQ